MKSLKMSKTIIWLILYFPVMILTNSCNTSNSPSDSKSDLISESSITTPDVPINTAVITGNIEAIKQHIKAKTNINEKEAMSGSTPLITAATFGKNDIAKLLIDAGANLSIQNNDGSTALHCAAFFCRIEIVQMLMDAHADMSIKNNFGATPRESVMGPFPSIKPIYIMLQEQLSPIGLKIDLNEIEKTRPVISNMLQ